MNKPVPRVRVSFKNNNVDSKGVNVLRMIMQYLNRCYSNKFTEQPFILPKFLNPEIEFCNNGLIKVKSDNYHQMRKILIIKALS